MQSRESFDLNLVEGKSAFTSTTAPETEVAEPPAQVPAPSVYRALWQRCCTRGDQGTGNSVTDFLGTRVAQPLVRPF